MPEFFEISEIDSAKSVDGLTESRMGCRREFEISIVGFLGNNFSSFLLGMRSLFLKKEKIISNGVLY